ncbi:MAG: exosortase/archaeosortase family protein [Planctomycetes bacterium]|nr:exosortase/archaeosortase family protein [Planctomycetota bacterium]
MTDNQEVLKTPSSQPADSTAAAIASGGPSGATRVYAVAGILAAIFIWAFWYSLVDLWRVWQNNPDYSAGQLVPLAVVYMVVVRRRTLAELPLRFDWRGVGLFVFGVSANLLGNYYLYASLQNLGLIVCANGLVMTLLGWQGYKRLWFPMVFLVLAVPLPGRVHDAVMLPLQRFVAQLSAMTLEVMGIPVARYGHILEVEGQQIAVAEACSGLRMALAFLMVAGVVVYLIQRPAWQKVTIVLSSLPIAVACNVTRVVATACLYGTKYEWLARDNMHEVMGLLMMPVALGLILLELWLLSKVAPARYDVENVGSLPDSSRETPSPGPAQ